MHNKYNFIDKLIAHYRHRELIKKDRLKNKKILDFGSGSNFKNFKIKYKSCKQAFLIDCYGKSFKSGKIEFLNYNNNYRLLEQNLKGEKFDIIILSAVIEHLTHPERIINLLKKYLDKNGYFLLTAPSKNSKWILEIMAYKLRIINKNLIIEHKKYYNKKEYKNLSKLTNLCLKKFYFFQFGMNTLAILK